MKYVLMNWFNDDIFTKEFDDAEEAKKCAIEEWNHTSEHDKKHTQAFYVLISSNPDEEAENHFDGDELIRFK